MTLIKPLRKPFRSRQRKHGLQPSKRRRARNLRGSVCPPTAAMPAKRRSPSKSSNPTALPNRASPKSRSSAALTASPSKSNKRDTVQTIRTIQMIQMIQTRLRPITNTSPGWITNSQTPRRGSDDDRLAIIRLRRRKQSSPNYRKLPLDRRILL